MMPHRAARALTATAAALTMMAAAGADAQVAKGSIVPATTTAAAATICRDLVWVDTYGDSCYAYTTSAYCTEDGGVGPGWNPVWGDIAEYADPATGVDGYAACCACGGGQEAAVDPDAAVCGDVAGWTDSGGEGCAEYVSMAYCTEAGGLGAGWDAADLGTISDW